jgi:S1-C subfamily serine protease
MRTTRARRAGLAGAAAVIIGGGGVALGATVLTPATPAIPSAAAADVMVPAAPSPSAAPASYADVVRQVLPSVVLIRTSEGLGSGVVLDRSGNIVTNAHVAGNATSFEVQVAGDPAPRSARLVGSYPPDDLAVIRAGDASGLQPARFGDSDRAQAGDVVLAVGNPLGLSGSVTEGIISATGRAVTEPATTPGSAAVALPGAIQTSAPINPGNSGGALVNVSGQVIGIPTLAAASPQGGAQAQGIGFAIPSNLARDIARQIITSGHVTNSHRAALGAQIANVTGAADGAPGGAGIVAVTAGGPADRAGLRPGDIIRSVGPAPTPDASALSQALAAARPGDRVTVTVTRGTETATSGTAPRTAGELTVHVTLGELAGS